MTRSIIVGDVRTGRRITQIPVADASWSMAHREPGDLRISIPLGAADFAKFERQVMGLYPGATTFLPIFPTPESGVWRPGQGLRPELLAALDPARCFVAVVEDYEVLVAGPIWSWDYDVASSVLTVGAKGLESLFDHRIVMGVLADWPSGNPAKWTVTYSGLSLATQAKRLIQLAMSHTGGDLPIDLPSDEASADAGHDRTWNGFDGGTVWERVRSLMNVEGGPDITLQPRLSDDRLGIRWVMRAGTIAQPLLHQPGAGDHTWDCRVPRGGVSGISVRRDASAMAQRAWVAGSGSEEALLLRYATDSTLLGRGFPLMESWETRGTVEVAATADRHAAANVRGGARPWMEWAFTVLAHPHGGPQLGQYRPGDFARVWVPADHPLLAMLLPEGFHRARILRVDGDMSETVRITCAPTMEAR